MAVDPADWSLDDLHEHLQAAVELELLVIPPYLCALYSLHPGTNEEARLIIRSVVVEEMLHMILAANLLNAVGGAPTVGSEWAPRYPAKIPYHEGDFEVGLLPFCEDALEAFLAIENPSHRLQARLLGISKGAATPRLMTLGDEEYATIGDFYAAIARGLEALVDRLGEGEVFSGDPRRQVGPEHYYASGGHAIEIHCLDTARQAITEIVEQGEGEVRAHDMFDADSDLAHYYRFNELQHGRRYLVGDDPTEPTGPPFELDMSAVYPMKRNLRAGDVAAGELRDSIEACNAIWSRLLSDIATAFDGTPDRLRVAVGTMFELKYAACALMKVPLPGGDGAHAGPTFEAG